MGVVGAGRAAVDLHLPTLGAIEGAEAVAIADPDPAALGAAEARFGVPRAVSDHRALLDDPSIEAICVAAPSHLHAEIAAAALEAGKHVLVEKPLALTLADCDRLVELASGSGPAATVGFNLRWHPQVRRARELIRSGALGKLSLLSTVFASPSLQREVPSWRVDPALGGGLLALQAIHHFDLWRFLLADEVESLSCAVGAEDAPGPDPGAAAISAASAGGVAIAGSLSAMTGQENGFAAYGTQAWAGASLYRFDGFELLPRDATAGDPARHARRPGRFAGELLRALPGIRRGGDLQASYRLEWEHFIDAARGEGPVECGFTDGREATRILVAAQESVAASGAVAAVSRPAAT